MSNLYADMKSRLPCSIPLGSMTQAIKTRRLLARVDIAVTVKKLSSGGAKGCIYGIEYPCELSGNVRTVLQQNGMGGF